MYKILLADNEGVVLDSLRHMILSRFGEMCDIRTAKTARYTRTLARKFVPDIAVINIQMPGMHGFDVVREIRSYHLRCLFITVSSYGRQTHQAEAASLNILAHLTKPLFRERIMPVMERAISLVSISQTRQQKNLQIQKKLDEAIPLLEHGMISQIFFQDSSGEAMKKYQELLSIPQNYGCIVTVTFGETADGALQNIIGSAFRLQREYMRLRELVREFFPLSVIGPVMGNHVLFLLPCWEEASSDIKEWRRTLPQLAEALCDAFPGLAFSAACGPVLPLASLSYADG